MTNDLTYEKIKEIVTNNPGITAQEFGEELKQSGTTDTKICDLFMDVIRSRGTDISNDRDTFLKTVELLVKSNIKIDIGDTVSNTVLDYAVVGGQPDVIKMLLGSDKFNPERKLHALSLTINKGKVQEFEVFLDYIDHAKILEALNKASCNENTDIMKVLLDNKRLTGVEKVDALSNAFIDGGLPKVRLLLKYMTGIPANGIRNLLGIIKESKLSLEKELKIDSEFKVDFDNSDHCKYLSNRVIIALLRSAINKKEEQNISDAEENNGVRFNNSNGNVSTGQVAVLDSSFVTRLYSSIARTINSVSFESLQQDLNRRKISFQSKCEQGAALETALLEHAIKDKNLKVIELLLENGVTIINTIEEGRYYISRIEKDKSILSSVVSDPDDNNAEVLRTLLQNINAEQSKLNPESELYRLYQQLKDDAFCTAFEKRNSVAAKVLIKNDQERIASHESAVNKNETPVITGTNQVVTTPNVEKDKPKPSGNKPAPPTPTEETDVGSTTTSSGDNKPHDFREDQFSPPNEKETKYKESKENFQTSLRNDVIGVFITVSFIAAAAMVPSIVGAAVCGIVAALALVATGIHVKDSTLPSYKEMREVELTKQSYLISANTGI